jgi:DNA-binding MarR family transcriptional regulator
MTTAPRATKPAPAKPPARKKSPAAHHLAPASPAGPRRQTASNGGTPVAPAGSSTGKGKTAPLRRVRIPPLAGMPGHYIRRLQQIAVALFLEETDAHAVTPVQYAALSAAQRQPDMDQRTLASSIGFDTSTIGGVIDRLERRGLLLRQASPDDRRVRLLRVTPEGEALLQQLTRPVLKAQQRILAPLPAADRDAFLAMLTTLVEANNDVSRAPREDT